MQSGFDSDAKNCGACGNSCTENVQNVNAASCTNGACDYDSCSSAEFDDCDEDRTNGCEVRPVQSSSAAADGSTSQAC
jgi:hypothetical protein